jgi:hypothetical protein
VYVVLGEREVATTECLDRTEAESSLFDLGSHVALQILNVSGNHGVVAFERQREVDDRHRADRDYQT